MQEKCDICLISVTKEIIIGIYKNNTLIDTMKDIGKSSDVLPLMFNKILSTYKINNIFYANGPGNFSAIKLTHIFLNTISMVLNINIYCKDSFYFTTDKYINAYGRIHFMKNNQSISTISLEKTFDTTFNLPQVINAESFEKHCTPLYILPAL